jgi:hypothetical protein
MQVHMRDWKARAAMYRMLVAAQTLCWAVVSLARIVRRPPPPPPATERIAAALVLGSIAGIAAGLGAFYLRRARSPDRDAVVLSWVCFQAAGFLALTGYAVAGNVPCFVVGILALAVMHAFSPNRFQTKLDA